MRVVGVERLEGPRRAYDLTVKNTHAYFVGPGVLAHNCGLTYENRKLVRAVTRGDGQIGQDITRNVLLMHGVVKMLPPMLGADPTPATVMIRGEIICKKSDFALHFKGESNPRNTASGTSKRESDNSKCAHLTVICYDIMPNLQPMASKMTELECLTRAGFLTPQWISCSFSQDVEYVYQEYLATKRAALDYDIDGLVVTLNDTAQREALGLSPDNRPKGAVAYKFPHETAVTTLRNIRWQVGNSGRITPVAEFDSVNLAGANVVQASLHNISNIRDLTNGLGFHTGDHIKVSRRNDVIPYLEELLATFPGERLLETPTECPSCKATLQRDGEYLVCRNPDCEAQATGAIKRWTEKLGVLHVGDSLIEAWLEAGLIADMADLYTMDPDDAAAVEIGGRVAGGSATKAITNLKAKMTLPLHVFVGSLGIPLIGRSMAKMIVDAGFNSLSKMLKAKVADIAGIPGVGDTKARAFVTGFQNRVGIVAKLLANGILIQDVTGALVGKSFCMTGFRDQALSDALEQQGGTMKGGVSRGLTYLIMQDTSSASGKAQKARQYGTQCISIDDAWALVGGKP